MKRNRPLVYYFFCFLFIFCSCKEHAQITNQKVVISNEKQLSSNNEININPDSIIYYGKSHLGKPYLAHTLDTSLQETLVVRTDGFDCNTFVETVIAQCINPNSIPDEIRQMRYRSGLVNGFASRIHYFTEWVYENQKRGLITDITKTLKGAEIYSPKINFIGTHRDKYIQIAKNDSLLSLIKSMEVGLNKLQWMYVPKSKINQCSFQIKNGDIIAITTNIQGLDISHLGFAYWDNNVLKLMHASYDFKKVMITAKAMSQYLANNKKQTGIMVLRLD